MGFEGFNYLYSLATVSATFVSLSIILWIFRQALGGGMNSYDSFFATSFIQVGFIVVAGSLVPPLLALYGLPAETVWRYSSLISAIPILVFVATMPGRRREATKEPMPLIVKLLLFFQLLCALYLLLNAFGFFLRFGAAPYATALAGILFSSGLAFVNRLEAVLKKHLKR